MKNLLSLLLILSAITTTMVLTACNTVKGVGEDVSAGGRGITKAADKVEQKIQN